MTLGARLARTIGHVTGRSVTSDGRRPVIVHYHIFKNAGSSLDAALRMHFGSRWMTIEAEATGMVSPGHLASFIERNPRAQAISSHTAVLPAPVMDGVIVMPVLFLRHPIERVWSMWSYEREQIEDTVGSLIARRTTFSGYVAWRMDSDDSITDFQTARLAPAGTGPMPLARALDALDKLSFVGVVERYDASLTALSVVLRRRFRGVALRSFHENQQEGQRPDLRSALGGSLYDRLVAANSDDLALWETALSRIVAARDDVATSRVGPR